MKHRACSGRAAALLGGAMVGGALALLYTPKTGSKLRSLLMSTEHKAEQEVHSLASRARKYMDDKSRGLIKAGLPQPPRKDESQARAMGLSIGLLAGVFAGATAATLYAPKSGKEIRHFLKVKAVDTRDGAVEIAEQAKDFAVEEARKVMAASSKAKREVEAKHC